jgi:pilus assembly protein CpaC
MIAVSTTQFWRSRLMCRRPAAFIAALVVFIIVVLVAAPQAQQVPAYTPGGTGFSAGSELSAPTDIDLLVGRSTVVNVGGPISRVSLTVPDVADAMVTAPGQLLIHGKQPGTISLFVWDKSGAIKTYEVNVRRDLSALADQMRQLFPGEPITVTGNGKDVVVSGTVSSKYVIERAADVAAGYVDKKENVVNLLKQQEGVASNQVMLRVRFAEVSRSALQELGASFIVNGFKSDWFGRASTQQFAAPDFDSDSNTGGLVFSDFLNLFVFNAKEGLGGVVRALQTKGLFQSLAEPNLIATNGKEASFLAGGEYPYPVVQPSSGGNSVTIMFKEFGIRLNFTPTVLGGDLINLKVRPEVSALDFSNAISLSGFRVPALSTRRTETEVELRDGQTFAIAGLMNNTLTSTMSKIPGIGDIPILGLLFKSRAHQKNQTELVVMITPTIIKRGQMGASEGLPTLVAPYMGRPEHAYPTPEPYVGSPRYPADRPARSSGSAADASTTQAPAAKPADQPTTSKPAKTPAAAAQTPAPAPQPAAAPVQAPLPSTPLVTAPATPAPATAAPAPAPSKDQAKALAKAQEQERRAAEAEAKERAAAEKKKAEEDAVIARRKAEEDAAAQKRKAIEDAAALKKAEAEKRQADKLAKERAAREAEIARKNEEASRKTVEQDRKREKALAEAAARLKQAQQDYELELQRVKNNPDAATQTAKKDPSSKQ